MSYENIVVPEGFENTERNRLILKIKALADKYFSRFRNIQKSIYLQLFSDLLKNSEENNCSIMESSIRFGNYAIQYDEESEDLVIYSWGESSYMFRIGGESGFPDYSLLNLLSGSGLFRDSDFLLYNFRGFMDEYTKLFASCKKYGHLSLFNILAQTKTNIKNSAKLVKDTKAEVKYFGDGSLVGVVDIKIFLKTGSIAWREYIEPRKILSALKFIDSLKISKIKETQEKEDEILIDESL